MRCLQPTAILMAAAFFFASTAFADDKTPQPHSDSPKSATNSAANNSAEPVASYPAESAEPAAANSNVPAADVAGSTVAVPPAPVPAPPPSGSADSEEPNWTPMPALDGNPGLYTLETGEIIPKHGFSIGVGLNKISSMPGSITSLQLIPSAGFGVTHWLSVFFDIDAQDHLHVGNPSQLSLSSVNAANPPYLNTIYNSVLPSTGFRPAYVEDIPFASHSGTGVGEVDLGFKIGLLSERRGKPLSLSIRNDFYFPTKTGLSDLLANQVQYGKFNYGIGVEASKTILHHSMTATANWAYRFTRNSSYTETIGGTPETVVLRLADQMQLGAGFLIFPDKRFQIISEYSSIIYVGGGIANTTFGPRDPVNNVSGFRLYAWKWAALTLGYRYSLDLTNHRDRNGFVIQVGAARWPLRPLPPDSVTASCAVDKPAVRQDSGGYIVATAHASDSNGRPLNYMWTASGGVIKGTGPYVRWDSTSVSAGTYVLTVRIDNGAGQSSGCSVNVTIEPK
jgi:hypothetical protein